MTFLVRHAQWLAYAAAAASGLILSACAFLAVVSLAGRGAGIGCFIVAPQKDLDLVFVFVIAAASFGMVVYELLAMVLEARGVARIKRGDMAATFNGRRYPLTTTRERLGLCVFFVVVPLFFVYRVGSGLEAANGCGEEPTPVTSTSIS